MPASVSIAASLSMFFAQPHSVCGQDDRVQTEFPPVAVVTDSVSGNTNYCTLTLVSDACAVTAGHCLHVLGEARFFVDAQHNKPISADEFVYKVDKNRTRALQSRIGNDWAVVRLRPNQVSGLLAGKVHGFIEPELARGTLTNAGLQATAVQRSGSNNFAQWKAQGQVLWTDASIVYHDLDTTAGSSGAILIDSATGRAVGIHTHGGCDTMKNNKGTLISEVPHLVRAINACRNDEP